MGVKSSGRTEYDGEGQPMTLYDGDWLQQRTKAGDQSDNRTHEKTDMLVVLSSYPGMDCATRRSFIF
jgi:hypothetical protein